MFLSSTRSTTRHAVVVGKRGRNPSSGKGGEEAGDDDDEEEEEEEESQQGAFVFGRLIEKDFSNFQIFFCVCLFYFQFCLCVCLCFLPCITHLIDQLNDVGVYAWV